MARLLEERKAFMKNAIHEAAVAILAEDGFDSLTMERVAEKAGVGKGSIYNYFPNKVELVRSVFDSSITPLKSAVESVAESDLPALQKLRQMLLAWFEYIDEHRGIINVLFNDQAIHKVLKLLDPSPREAPIQLFTTVFEQGIAEGVFRDFATKDIATMLFVVCTDVSDTNAAGQQEWQIERSVDLILDFFLGGIAKKPSS